MYNVYVEQFQEDSYYTLQYEVILWEVGNCAVKQRW